MTKGHRHSMWRSLYMCSLGCGRESPSDGPSRTSFHRKEDILAMADILPSKSAPLPPPLAPALISPLGNSVPCRADDMSTVVASQGMTRHSCHSLSSGATEQVVAERFKNVASAADGDETAGKGWADKGMEQEEEGQEQTDFPTFSLALLPSTRKAFISPFAASPGRMSTDYPDSIVSIQGPISTCLITENSDQAVVKPRPPMSKRASQSSNGRGQAKEASLSRLGLASLMRAAFGEDATTRGPPQLPPLAAASRGSGLPLLSPSSSASLTRHRSMSAGEAMGMLQQQQQQPGRMARLQYRRSSSFSSSSASTNTPTTPIQKSFEFLGMVGSPASPSTALLCEQQQQQQQEPGGGGGGGVAEQGGQMVLKEEEEEETLVFKIHPCTWSGSPAKMSAGNHITGGAVAAAAPASAAEGTLAFTPTASRGAGRHSIDVGVGGVITTPAILFTAASISCPLMITSRDPRKAVRSEDGNGGSRRSLLLAPVPFPPLFPSITNTGPNSCPLSPLGPSLELREDAAGRLRTMAKGYRTRAKTTLVEATRKQAEDQAIADQGRLEKECWDTKLSRSTTMRQRDPDLQVSEQVGKFLLGGCKWSSEIALMVVGEQADALNPLGTLGGGGGGRVSWGGLGEGGGAESRWGPGPELELAAVRPFSSDDVRGGQLRRQLSSIPEGGGAAGASHPEQERLSLPLMKMRI